MAEVADNTPERYVSKGNMTWLMSGIKAYVDIYGSGPDGTMDITKNSSGEITQIVLTYSGGVRTTTFTKSSNSETIIQRDVETGASAAIVKTITINNSTNQVTIATTTEPITGS